MHTCLISLFSAQSQALDCHLQLTSTFHSHHNTYSKKKNQMLLLDSLLNSNANNFHNLCMCAHIYATVDFSFQSFAQFLFFLWPHRSWYPISRTLRNAELYSVTLSSVYDEECSFLGSWWMLVEKFSSLHREVTKQKGQEAALGCKLCPTHSSHCWASVLFKQERWVGSGAELWHVWVTVIAQEHGEWGGRDGTGFPQGWTPAQGDGPCALSKEANHESFITSPPNLWVTGLLLGLVINLAIGSAC